MFDLLRGSDRQGVRFIVNIRLIDIDENARQYLLSSLQGLRVCHYLACSGSMFGFINSFLLRVCCTSAGLHFFCYERVCRARGVCCAGGCAGAGAISSGSVVVFPLTPLPTPKLF